MSQAESFQKLKQLSDAYYSGKPLVSDEIYDSLLHQYESKWGQFKYIRSESEIEKVLGNRVKLPVYMGSLNKFENPEQIREWNQRYPNTDKIITPKIDGASFLVHYLPGNIIKTYGHSTPIYALPMDHLIPFLNLPILDVKHELIVRGELIINKNNFQKYNQAHPDKEYKDPLNWVNSNSRKKIIDPDTLKYLEFVAYEQMVPITDKTSIRLMRLKSLGFKTVPFIPISTSDLTVEIIEQQLVDWQTSYSYTIDGVVIYIDSVYHLEQYRNPTYAFAFKQHHFRNVKVISVEWNLNKGKITPVIIFEPFQWKNYDISETKTYTKTTGHNAKSIIEHQVGPGAVIQLCYMIPLWVWHRVVISPASQPSSPPGDWHWNETETEAIQVTESTETRIKKLEYFVCQLKIQNIKAKTINKLYQAGFQSVRDLLNISVQDVESIEGFGHTSAQEIVENIQTGVSQANLADLLAGSCIFSSNFGKKKFQIIVDQYDVIDLAELLKCGEITTDDVVKLVGQVRGIGSILANQFANKLVKFLDFITEISEFIPFLNCQLDEKPKTITPPVKSEMELSETKNKPDMPLHIVLSDFKNKEHYRQIILSRGGSTDSNITNQTSILVIGDESVQTSKRKLAETKISKGVPIHIMTLDDFIYYYQL